MASAAHSASVTSPTPASAVVASFGLLDQVCRRAALTYRSKQRRFEVHLTDVGQVWTYDPRGGMRCFVPGSLGDVDLRLYVTSLAWLSFVLARSFDVDASAFRIEGDVTCLAPLMHAVGPKSWLEARSSS